MKQSFPHFRPLRFVCALLMSGVLLVSCGFTAFAAEAPQTAASPAATPLPPYPEDMADGLYPADVRTVFEAGTRQIAKTYILSAEQDPADIPRDSFELGGWLYTLTDVTETKNSETDTRAHTETVEVSTDSSDLNAILKQLSPTLDYQSEDGYSGVLALDVSSVTCEAAGYKKNSYTVSATREYPHLSSNDLSLIPKSITDSGRTLTLDDVSWEIQQTVNVDDEDIPDSYRAVATYTASASKSVVTGYVTKAEYTGEISKVVEGNTVYTAYFWGSELIVTPEPTPTPAPKPTPVPKPSEAPVPSSQGSGLLFSILLSLAVLIAAAALVSYFQRQNVKVYSVREGYRELIAKRKISAKNPVIDLTPLDGKCFSIEIEGLTARTLDGVTIEVRHGPASLYQKVAYEGNAYRMAADFGAGTVQAVYK